MHISPFLQDDILALGKSKCCRSPGTDLPSGLSFLFPTNVISFAWAEMRTVCANILSRFDIEEVAGQHVEFKQHVTMVFATGRWRVRLTPRQLHV